MAETTQNVPLPPRQSHALAVLLEGGTVSHAAKCAGVNRKTVAGWMKLPAFRDALADGQKQAVETAVRRLSAMSGKALGVLEGVLDDPETPHSVKVQAFNAIMSHLFKLHELTTLSDEVARLEAKLEERGL